MLNHRGKILRTVVDKYCAANGMSISALAKKVGYDQSTFYRHTEKEELGFHIIRRYGRAMNHDFREEFPEMQDEMSMVNEPFPEKYGNATITLSQCLEERNQWKEKYYSLLEIHNKMLRDKLESAGL